MKKVLFVCTGNTCRSPMTEAYFNSVSGGKHAAFSRGLFSDGSPISENAKQVLLENGIETSHVSMRLTEKDIENADMIFGMTKRHGQAVLDRFPSSAGKVFSMPQDIEDPYGSDIETYRKCFEEIKASVGLIYEALGE